MQPEAEVLLGQQQLRAVVARRGRELSEAYPSGFLAVAVLKGSVPFIADLARAVEVPMQVDFLAISPFAANTGRVRVVKDLDHDIGGRDVVVVQSLVDTGLTIGYLMGELGRRAPASLELCALLDRRERRILPVDVAFRGIEVPDHYLIGYGLDHVGRYRNLDCIVRADPAILADDPDAYVANVYHAASNTRH